MGIGVEVVSIDKLVEQHLKGLDALVTKEDPGAPPSLYTYIMKSFQSNKDARENGGVNKIMMDSLRAYNGQYDPEDWAVIREEGGSTIYMNLTSTKVRAAISWIKDILLAGKEDAFSISPTPLVDLPDDVKESIRARVEQDFDRMLEESKAPPAEQQQQAQPPDVVETLKEINEYKRDLYDAVKEEMDKEAQFAFKIIETKIKDQMKEGEWEKALSEFIDDFCIFPTAFLRGPIVTVRKRLKWENGSAVPVEDYVMMNRRVSPLDVYPAPEASCVQDGDFCVHLRLSRKELGTLKKATEAGYKPEAISRVLKNNDGLGLSSALDHNIESEKAVEEMRDDINSANENVFHGIHYMGSVPCKLLKEWGYVDPQLEGMDDDEPVEVDAIVVGSEIIRCVLNDDPLGRRPYYSASYQKRPGSIWGISTPYMMRDIQRLCNACARALANNMGLSSGPIAEVNIDRLADGQDLSQLQPRDIIQTTSDPTGASGKAINFFAIPSIASELLAVYKEFELKADDVTMIPRYSYGQQQATGAAAALADYERVLTPSGSVEIGLIEVGDTVCNTYGSSSKVLGVYPQGSRDIFRVFFSNGEHVDCDMEHRWSVRSHHDREFRTLTTKEILDKGIYKDTVVSPKNPTGKRPKWHIPMYLPVELEERPVAIDPYTFGAVLGDGDARGRLTGMDKEIFDRIPYELGKIDRKLNNQAWSQTIIGIKPMLREYLGGANCHTKFIPNDYLMNSVEIRVELLRGLMDTDGCISKTGECFYFTTSKQLAEDFKTLVKSLGGTVKSIQIREDPRENRSTGYRISFNTPMCPVYLKRKADRWKNKDLGYTYITGIDYIGEHTATCITVDSTNSLYLVDNFIVTHNTASGLSMLLESASKGIKDAIRHIDEGIIIPRVEMEFYTTMLRGDHEFTGDINVIARGSSSLTLAGAEQMRRNEFLQVTANPIDQELLGPIGRAEILRRMVKDLNLGETVVPNRQEIKALMKKKAQAQQAPPPQVQAAQVQNDTIYKIAQERNQIAAADMQRKQAKDEADVALKAREQEVRLQAENTKALAALEKTKISTASEEHRNAQNIALELETQQNV